MTNAKKEKRETEMRFKKRFYACRYDGNVQLKEFLANGTDQDVSSCMYYIKGKCNNDGKKCKLVAYVREDKT